MIHHSYKKGFTLGEVIIASFLFTIVAVIGVGILVDVFQLQRRVDLESAMYEDGRVMMERLARAISQNTIDYEEYYRANAVAAGGGLLLHGQGFGCYAQRFYNPGEPKELGALCTDGSDPRDNPGCIVRKPTLDVNTGQNPYVGLGGSLEANAFCDQNYHSDADCSLGSDDVSLRQEELYLIAPGGHAKMFIGRKLVNTETSEHAVALLELRGQDVDTDGVIETWYKSDTKYEEFCAPGYVCPSSLDNLTKNLDGSDGEALYTGFVPITPLRSDVTDLYFYVSPVEDPHKAFAETSPDEGIQQQPHVTIVMKLKPAASELTGFDGAPPEITLQSTINSRAYSEVKSYIGAPLPECLLVS